MIRCPCCGGLFDGGVCLRCGALGSGPFVVCLPDEAMPERRVLTTAEQAIALRLLRQALAKDDETS
jgi:hypothetical protein